MNGKANEEMKHTCLQQYICKRGELRRKSYKRIMCFARPIINNKFEEKTCGDGPSLATMFEDDKHLQTIIYSIRVSLCTSKKG